MLLLGQLGQLKQGVLTMLMLCHAMLESSQDPLWIPR
jgi:hypothetical protein